MITFFSIPKPFRGHEKIIQTNAVRSWSRIEPRCETILFGEEEGLAEAAEMLGARHERDGEKNEHGTPILSHVFDRAQEIARHDVLCYANGDIILLNDVIEAVRSVAATQKRFLIVGRRHDCDITELIDFDQPQWEANLREAVRARGVLASLKAIDYFIFPRGLLRDAMPPFLVGRPAWDNWMIWKARSLGAPVVNATGAVTAVHQNHPRSWHVKGTRQAEEGDYNFRIAGGGLRCYTIAQASHFLQNGTLRTRPAHQLDFSRIVMGKAWRRMKRVAGLAKDD